MKKQTNVSKNYLYNLAYQILLIIIPIISTPYLSRVLGSEGIGIYSYTISIATYFILFGTIGISMYGQREIAYNQTNKEKYSKIFLSLMIIRFITLTISSIIFILMFMQKGEYKEYYKILLFLILINNLDISWLYQGLEEFKKITLRSTIAKIIGVIFIFIFVKTKEDLINYLIVYVLSNFLVNISVWLSLKKYIVITKVKKNDILIHIKPVLLLFIPQIATSIYTVLDKVMLGNILNNMNEVGYYEQAQVIVKTALTIITSLGTVMLTKMANENSKGNKERIINYLKIAFNFTWFLGIPIMLGIIGISSNFVAWFFGTEFSSVSNLLILNSPVVLFIGFSNILGIQYLVAIKKQNIFTITILIGAITNVLLNFVLIPILAARGAIISSVIAEFLVLIAQLFFIRREIPMKSLMISIWKYIISGILMLLAIYCIGIIMADGFIVTCVQVILGIAIYVIMLIILKDEFFQKYILYFIKNMLRIKESA